jgi:hypothetical protein
MLLALAMLAVSASSALAYSYSYSLTTRSDDTWYSRWVAHNYSYISGHNDSGTVIECITATRTSTGDNYGGVVCTSGTGSASRHYYGDVGLYSWGKNDSPSNLCCWDIHMYEEW